MDRLSVLLMRFGYTVETFYRGTFCGENLLAAEPGIGHLHLVRSGQVSFHQDGAPPLLVAQPTLVLYPRACAHRLESSAGTELLCATIRPHGSPDGLARTLPPMIALPFQHVPALAHTIELLFTEADQPNFGQKLILDRLCDVLLIQLLRHLLAQQLTSEPALYGMSDTALSKALAAMHSQPGEPWTVESLALLSGMSRSKFAQRFRSLTGVTPAEYLLEQRMSLAKRLLLHGRQVQDVASHVGYSTQPAFTRAFRSACNMSPRDWMAQAGCA
jgi:AraC-like DNA-binding protein